MASEITEEEDEEGLFVINKEAQKNKIRQIIEYQKSLYFSSSSSSSYSSQSASCSSFASSRTSTSTSTSLFDLMRGGSTSLRRLFDMEHTSLGTHMNEYSGSPLIRPILLWGSDSDGAYDDPWMGINKTRTLKYCSTSPRGLDSERSFTDNESAYENRKQKTGKRNLIRTKTFRRLPRFIQWRCRGFRFKLRLRRIRIMICGRIF